MNPALGARCFLLIAFAADMTKFGITKNGIEVYSSVTPLAAMRNGEAVNTMDMLIGRTAGTIGETSAIAILSYFPDPDGCDQPSHPGILHYYICCIHAFIRRSWI